MSRAKKPKHEYRQLDELHPFPAQTEFFVDLPDDQLEALAADIETNGLKNPPEILPQNSAGFPRNTIISGHQRVRALQMEGYDEVEVLVRYDLADADAARIEACFLEENQNRRHMSKLAQARVALRLVELEKRRRRGQLEHWEYATARDRVGKRIGMTGRNLQRYLCILRTPLPVQEAFDGGKLPLVLAARVGTLSSDVQTEIAERISRGEDAKQVVDSYKERKRRNVNALVNDLQKAIRGLDGRVAELRGRPRNGEIKTLEKGQQIIGQVIRQYRRNQKQHQKAMDKLQRLSVSRRSRHS